MRRDIFMGKLNTENFSQRLQDLNRYLDVIPIEKTSDKDKIIKAYGKYCQKMKSGPLWDEQFHLNGQ
jgi:hypothetical protein